MVTLHSQLFTLHCLLLELERTFLAKFFPSDLESHPHKEYTDLLLPVSARHPHLRLRKRGDVMELTKKTLAGEDHSMCIEQTIELDQDEYDALATLPSKRVRKKRYFYPLVGKTAEVDVFLDDLAGLVLMDFEFESEEEKRAFIPPDCCLAEVTEEETIAGGYLAGKSSAEIAPTLEQYEYQPIFSGNKKEESAREVTPSPF